MAISRKLATVIGVGAFAIAGLSTGTAMAYGTVYHGNDYARVSLDGAYDKMEPRDQEADGNGVYANWYESDGTGPWKMWDGNGSQAGGNTYWTLYYISPFRVCEDTKGCSSWKY